MADDYINLNILDPSGAPLDFLLAVQYSIQDNYYSGPPYPRPGEPPFDIWKTVISQYANSPVFTQLLVNLGDYLDPTANLDEFYRLVWDVATAEKYGLDVWGRIVGVNRVLQVSAGDWFGFEEATPGSQPFNQGIFYQGQRATSSFSLSDESYRLLIMAKAAANITDGGIPALNRILMALFPNRGNAYVTDGNDMTMTYTFEFDLSPVELAIVQNSGVLPKSTGVGAQVIILS